MTDLLYIAIVVAFFALAVVVVVVCDRLSGGARGASDLLDAMLRPTKLGDDS
jgi:hypothetical protein